MSNVRKAGLLGCCALALAACTVDDLQPEASSVKPRPLAYSSIAPDLVSSIPKSAIDTLPRQEAAEGLTALQQNSLSAASAAFNQALKMDIQNSYLQFFNALTYHLMAVEGHSEDFPLAEQGYDLAVKFDQSNWLARYYHGLLDLDQKQWGKAEQNFAQAAFLRPDDPDVLYELAAASYYAGRPGVAYAALNHLHKLGGPRGSDARTLQGLCVTTAALGKVREAEKYLAALRALPSESDNAVRLQDRINSWKGLYASSHSLLRETRRNGYRKSKLKHLVQFAEPDTSDGENGFGADTGADQPGAQPPVQPGASSDSTFADTQMVMVDVVLIGTEENDTHTRGVNLLDGLQLQFGNPLAANPAAIGWSQNNTNQFLSVPDPNGGGGTSNIQTLISAIQIPSITYSLNIMNANNSRSEIIAKPTLTALVGQPSQFFSGVDVNAAAVSGAAGNSISFQKQIGVLLKVTPQLLPDNMVKLSVKAQRTFLTDPSRQVFFQYRVDTTKTPSTQMWR